MLDDDLVDFSMSLPAKMKVRGLTLRPFFKRALRDFSAAADSAQTQARVRDALRRLACA
jgi:hypothetical protein